MYDFDKYMYTDITKTDFIEIEKIEPDPDIRRLKYPHVTHQKKTIMTYVIDNKKIIRILKTNKLKGKKNILHRRLNLKYFGNSLESMIILLIIQIIIQKIFLDLLNLNIMKKKLKMNKKLIL